MKIKFSFALETDDSENLSRTVEFEAKDCFRAEILAVQIIKQLENAKLDAEFDGVFDRHFCEAGLSQPLTS